MALWCDSGSSRRNCQVDPWRWSAGDGALACFMVFKWLSPNEAFPSAEMNLCRGTWEGSSEG
eukprot:771679-Pyramimonas_sp.AAC.1